MSLFIQNVYTQFAHKYNKYKKMKTNKVKYIFALIAVLQYFIKQIKIFKNEKKWLF